VDAKQKQINNLNYNKMNISKQKRNLINELSFWIIREIETLNDNSINNTKLDNKTNIKTLINVIKSSKHYTNKQIKDLINDLKYQLPF
jgi:translation initiation factor IF-2